MFRCQFSGEKSESKKTQWVEITDEDTGRKKRVQVMSSAPDKPVTVVIATRRQTYQHLRDRDGRPCRPRDADPEKSYTSQGSEIVKELKVLPKYAQLVQEMVARGEPVIFNRTKHAIK